jgi:hypothetical protein
MHKPHGFIVSIYHEGVILAEEVSSLPPHKLVLRPILDDAEFAVVIGAPADSRAVRESAAILTPDRGRFRIALDREPIHGYERLWNAGSGQRGTIVIKSRITDERLATVFRFCGEAWRCETKSEPEPFGIESLRFAASEVAPGRRVFMLSRSNGIQWLGVYAVPSEWARLFEIAKWRCKPFKREFEVSDPKGYNIIGQYDRVDVA